MAEEQPGRKRWIFTYWSTVVISKAITRMDEMGTDDGFFNATMGAY